MKIRIQNNPVACLLIGVAMAAVGIWIRCWIGGDPLIRFPFLE